MFRIGQKVACFDDRRMLGLIKKDQVLTISSVEKTILGETGLLFVEGPPPPVPFVGYNARFFRPVTDISVFKEMLNVKKIEENIDA